jgi:hypothetical protein
MKDIKIETVIRNSEKIDESFQVNPSLIVKDIEEDMQKSNLYNQTHNEQQELELNDDLMKKVDRFLRKITPLMEKELEENLPLYNRKLVAM